MKTPKKNDGDKEKDRNFAPGNKKPKTATKARNVSLEEFMSVPKTLAMGTK